MANPRKAAQQAISLLEQALQESEARIAELDEQVKRKRPDKNQIESKLEVVTHRLELAEQERDCWKADAQQMEAVLEQERAKVAQLRQKLDVAESGPDRVAKKELNFWRARVEAFDNDTAEYKQKLAGLSQELKKRSGLVVRLEQRIESLEGKLGERRQQMETLAQRLADSGSTNEGLQAEIHALQARCADHDGNTEQQAHRVSELNEELGRSRADAERARTELRELREALQDSTDQLSSRNNDVAVLESELLTTREQFNSLELELRDEKERADALTELANERLDRLSALHEDLEAADERVSELDWQLSRSRHLQALVARRKRLVSNLIGEIRAKKKSNEALKAGLDSLRIFKSAAEERQAKLTHRIEDLNERLAAAEENAHHARAAHSDEQGTAARVTDLQARLATQAELIESLEQEVVQLRRQLGSGAGADSADLETELAEKEQTIQRLAAAVKAREATISDLQNQVSGWQRKYEFLATPENPHDLGIPKKAAGGPSEP